MRGITRVDTCLRSSDHATRNSHSHNECEVCFILRGQKQVEVDDKIVTMDTGSLLFINKQIPHRTVSVSENSCDYFTICYHPELITEWQKNIPDTDLQFLFSRDFVFLEPHLMDQVFIQGIIKVLTQSYAAKMQSIFNLKLVELNVYLVLKSYLVDWIGSGKKRSIKRKWYKDMINYIAENNYDVTIDELCNQFYLSRYYICHLFKEEGGLTLNEFIHTNKVRTAIVLLETTKMRIIDIAEECGYNSLGTFGRTFKQYTGVSPSEYRKRYRGNK